MQFIFSLVMQHDMRGTNRACFVRLFTLEYPILRYLAAGACGLDNAGTVRGQDIALEDSINLIYEEPTVSLDMYNGRGEIDHAIVIVPSSEIYS